MLFVAMLRKLKRPRAHFYGCTCYRINSSSINLPNFAVPLLNACSGGDQNWTQYEYVKRAGSFCRDKRTGPQDNYGVHDPMTSRS